MGSIGRVPHIIVGLALLALPFALDGPVRFVGLIGSVPLLTAACGFRPAYRLLGLNTGPLPRDKARVRGGT